MCYWWQLIGQCRQAPKVMALRTSHEGRTFRFLCLCYPLNEHLCLEAVCHHAGDCERTLISPPPTPHPWICQSLLKSPRLALAGTLVPRSHLNLSVCLYLCLSHLPPFLLPSISSYNSAISLSKIFFVVWEFHSENLPEKQYGSHWLRVAFMAPVFLRC